MAGRFGSVAAMRRRCWNGPVLAVALVWLAAAPAALAQTEPTPEQPPPEQPPPTGQPLPPDLVLSGRDARLNRAGYVHVKIGCRKTIVAPEACLGTLTLRLGEPVTFTAPPKGGGSPRRQRLGAIQIGTAQFQLAVGLAQRLTVRLTPLVQRAVRQLGSVSVQLIGTYVSRSGQGSTTKRFITLYFPKQPPQV
jgi:hypothetical protein